MVEVAGFLLGSPNHNISVGPIKLLKVPENPQLSPGEVAIICYSSGGAKGWELSEVFPEVDPFHVEWTASFVLWVNSDSSRKWGIMVE